MESFADLFFRETTEILQRVDRGDVEALVDALADLRAREGRLFVLGVGGSAANAGHAVNDFRKICGLEAYAPTDNVAELTARVNDDGWETCFSEWLRGSRLRANDALFVLSVGGGDRAKNVSPNLVHAIEVAKEVGARVLGIVGRDGGHTRASAHASVVIPALFGDRVTPHTEGLCAVVWHLLVSHPKLAVRSTKWESVR